tara:strand:+ start:327 stop:497 length:171 start_codon:yes stop_codon:yes gene_type:complete
MIDKDIEIEFLNAQLDYVTEQLKEERLIVEAMQEYVNAVGDDVEAIIDTLDKRVIS